MELLDQLSQVKNWIFTVTHWGNNKIDLHSFDNTVMVEYFYNEIVHKSISISIRNPSNPNSVVKSRRLPVHMAMALSFTDREVVS